MDDIQRVKQALASVDLKAVGAFSTPVNLAFLIRDGEVLGRLPQLTLTSSLAEMFGSRFLGTSSDGARQTASNPHLFAEMDIFVNSSGA